MRKLTAHNRLAATGRSSQIKQRARSYTLTRQRRNSPTCADYQKKYPFFIDLKTQLAGFPNPFWCVIPQMHEKESGCTTFTHPIRSTVSFMFRHTFYLHLNHSRKDHVLKVRPGRPLCLLLLQHGVIKRVITNRSLIVLGDEPPCVSKENNMLSD